MCVCVIITFEVSLFFCLKETNGAFRESNLFMNTLASFEQWVFYFKAKETRLIVCFHGNKGDLYILKNLLPDSCSVLALLQMERSSSFPCRYYCSLFGNKFLLS